jgi:hypothetical protein
VNEWADATGLCRTHISRILAMSTGINHAPEELAAYMGE